MAAARALLPTPQCCQYRYTFLGKPTFSCHLCAMGHTCCLRLLIFCCYGLSASALATSRRTLGDMVDESTTLFTYAPFAPVGRARTTASMTDVRLAINASSLNESFPAGICRSAVLSTLNSTRPAFTSWMVFARSKVMVPAL